jgi:uncharacterized membrane protein
VLRSRRGFADVDVGVPVVRLLALQIFEKGFQDFIFRWLHILMGIAWIGLLYYFNFVQVPSFAEMDAGTRNQTVDKLGSRALWWFRWAAVATLVTGLLILGTQRGPDGAMSYGFKTDYWGTIEGTSILSGILLALVMFANVWLVIWPKQRIVIANARNVLAGGEADAGAAPAGRRALLASRTNALLSIPMVWFMTATAHFSFAFKTSNGLIGYWIFVIVITAIIEANALGFLGGTGPGPLRAPLETVTNVLVSGFVLWLVFYLVGWEAILGTK